MDLKKFVSLGEALPNKLATFESINSDCLLRQRLIDIGFVRGRDIEKIECSFGNVVVRVGDMLMGVSKEVAYKINMRYKN